jgi:hypothetical protein
VAWKLRRKRRRFENTDRLRGWVEERRRKDYNVVHKLIFLQVPLEEVNGVNEILDNLLPVFLYSLDMLWDVVTRVRRHPLKQIITMRVTDNQGSQAKFS